VLDGRQRGRGLHSKLGCAGRCALVGHGFTGRGKPMAGPCARITCGSYHGMLLYSSYCTTSGNSNNKVVTRCCANTTKASHTGFRCCACARSTVLVGPTHTKSEHNPSCHCAAQAHTRSLPCHSLQRSWPRGSSSRTAWRCSVPLLREVAAPRLPTQGAATLG
jgi:hypothetical protein